MVRAALFLLLAAASAFAQAAAPGKALQEARKKAAEELNTMKADMLKQGFKGEADDCDSILAKLLTPDKLINEKGMSTPYPGDDKLKDLMKAWAELGDRLKAIYTEAAGQLEGAAKEECEMFAGWFVSWRDVGNGVLHLNARRKFCKLTPVMADWSGSLGGYLHGRYLAKNANEPSAQGLGAHKEDMKLPCFTLEGAAAAGGILGGGSSERCMDGWLGSAYHRDPVLSRNCSRVCFGGLSPNGWWSCRTAGGGSGQALGDVITFPGDGDTDISPVFGGEGPNPLQKFGMTDSGTLFSIEFLRGQLKKPTVKLTDADGKEAELLEIQRFPMIFAAKSALKENTKYTVTLTGQDGAKFSFSFTTSGNPFAPRPK